MNVNKAKDRILSYLAKDKDADVKTNELSRALSIDDTALFALCESLHDDGVIKFRDLSSINDFQFGVASITPKGYLWRQNNSYVRLGRSHYIEKWPNKYWYIVGLIAYLGGVATPIITEKVKSLFQEPTKKESTKQDANKMQPS
jgi:hypothetical protein